MAIADTIAAIATAPGRGGIGVVRISGKNLEGLILAMLGRPLKARRASLRKFLGADGESLDEGIAIYYPLPNSYTGEDIVELQGHGGPAVLRLVLQRCLDCGARLAEPGEFTRRAFLSGKIDLAQAEAVADLIEADSAAAARCAFRSLQGDLSTLLKKANEDLIELRARIEAALDFPEEEIDALDRATATIRLKGLISELDAIIATSRQGRILHEGIRVALVGAPNVGKSSLLNRLAKDDVAIVSDIPGTTRDIVQQRIQIDGIPIDVADTAGLRESNDAIEKMGVSRAWAAAEQADVAVLIAEAGSDPAVLRQVADRLPKQQARIRVWNKIDLLACPASLSETHGEINVRVSAKTGEGLDLLRQALLAAAGWNPESEGALVARERHFRAIAAAQSYLHLALAAGDNTELVAEELRSAQMSLASITGEFVADDLLGAIFAKFCVGK